MLTRSRSDRYNAEEPDAYHTNRYAKIRAFEYGREFFPSNCVSHRKGFFAVTP